MRNIVAAILLAIIFVVPGIAQEEAIDQAEADREPVKAEIPANLLDVSVPFDVIHTTAEAGGESVSVFPIENMPGGQRRFPAAVDGGEELEVSLLVYPDRKYRVFWRDIEKIDFYEQLVLQEARAKLESKEYGVAFEYLNFLIDEYPETENLDSLRREFLLQSALGMFQRGELAHSLAVFEELRRSDPDWKRAEVEAAISKVASQLIEKYFNDGRLQIAQQMVSRLAAVYGRDFSVVQQWIDRFRMLAKTYFDEAEQLFGRDEHIAAYETALRVQAVSPEYPGIGELLSRIRSDRPTLRVGVAQTTQQPDPSAIADWPARRVGSLLTRPLFEFKSTGPEGGEYEFSLGTADVSLDQTEIDFRLSSRSMPEAAGAGDLARWMTRAADPASPQYNPGFAALFRRAYVEGQYYCRLQLRQSHVLPIAFMQWPTSLAPGPLSEIQTNYREASRDDKKVVYTWRSEETPAELQPVDIIEVLYDSPNAAISDMLSGRIDCIDRVFPSDAQRLATDGRIVVEPYALPIVHMLVPKSDHPFMQMVGFRRALLYAIDRESILKDVLLGSELTAESKPVSGPFPRGTGQNDPLSYAYNDAIEPLPFDLNVAKALALTTKNIFDRQADKDAIDKSKPEALKAKKIEMPELTLGVPDFEAARAAGAMIVQYWTRIGIPSRVVVLAGDDKDAAVDLLYVSAAMWEPAVDAQRLLGTGGMADTNNPYIVQALTQLRLARNWREVRQACQDLHTLVDAHLPILPLFQIGESFAYRQGVSGVPNRPISLYQDIWRWRLDLPAPAVASRDQ